MLCAFRQEMTEYESGWGQRPDGFIYSLEKHLLEERVKDACQRGSYDYYSRSAGEIEVVVISPEFAKKLMSEKTHWTSKLPHPHDQGPIRDLRMILTSKA